MKIVKFEGPTMREALARVKAELGENAVVVSTRTVRRGLLGGTAYEIAAAIDEDAALDLGPRTGLERPKQNNGTNEVSSAIAPIKSELRSLRAMVRAGGDNRSTTELRNEVAELKKLIQTLQHVDRAPAAAPAPAAEPPRNNKRAATRSDAAAPLVAPSTARVVALVGPTGAGKTTTIAKLAAHAALVERRRVAVITVDNYRVGGVDQIRTFADLIGIPLVVADHPDQLSTCVDDLADRDLILIDTAGRSPRDRAAIDELAIGLQNLEDIEVHLTIPAATPAVILDDLHQRYRPLQPRRILFTKLDETDPTPLLADAPSRLGLPLTWVTTGQQVPEDLEQPTAERLAELAGQSARAPTNPPTSRSTSARTLGNRYAA
jgi:flagellar biosynthesis protein FlhF